MKTTTATKERTGRSYPEHVGYRLPYTVYWQYDMFRNPERPDRAVCAIVERNGQRRECVIALEPVGDTRAYHVYIDGAPIVNPITEAAKDFVTFPDAWQEMEHAAMKLGNRMGKGGR